ncbi:MAG TPA: hypothetical protein VNJ53_06430 [Gaiellaceae bacterium]|nr:hypothetical protein [Gaiellaceae bacterium]
MTLDDWILGFHVLSAFALVSGMVALWTLALAAPGADVATASRVARAAVLSGSVGTLVFGAWLALTVDGYDLWDGWIAAAFVLWTVGVAAGARSSVAFRSGDRARGVALHAVSTLALVLVLADMIWKPGT